MHILVTGGAGFVGTNLIKKLLSDGHHVISIDNYTTGKKENHIDGCEYHNYDIRDIDGYDGLVNDISKPDVIFHMAAVARIQPSFEDPKNYFTTNANGTLNVVNYCANNNIPLIYAGSSSHHAGKFSNPYTFTKDVGEEIIKLYETHFNLKASIARFYNVYGPYQLTEGGYTTLIGRWMNNIKNDKACDIFGDGEKRRDFTHVSDIVDGLIRIMKQQAYGHNFEFGRGKNYSINEVAKIFDIVPWYQPDKPGEAQNTLADHSLASEILAWEPKIDLADYIYKQQKW
tara:strand:+ start:1375 stop:2232 length:858 start_codon:yes stop_codon:yes gene_type:complete